MLTNPGNMKQERRLYARTPVRLGVLWESESLGIFAQVTEISSAGCFINTAFGIWEGACRAAGTSR